MKIPFLSISVIAMFILCSCGPTGTKVKDEGQKVSESEKSKGESEKNLTFKIGEDVKLGDFIVKVTKVTDHKSTDEFMQPKEGMKLVALEVEYFNPTGDKQFDANPMDWTAFDSEGYSYDYGMNDNKEPALNATTINPKGKVKGWVTFEVNKNAQLTKAQFKPSLFDNANIEFQLQ